MACPLLSSLSVSSGGGDLTLGLSASTRHILEQICNPSPPGFSTLVIFQFRVNITPCTSASCDCVGGHNDQCLLLSRVPATRLETSSNPGWATILQCLLCTLQPAGVLGPAGAVPSRRASVGAALSVTAQPGSSQLCPSALALRATVTYHMCPNSLVTLTLTPKSWWEPQVEDEEGATQVRFRRGWWGSR